MEKRGTYDAWAVLLIGKVLALHCEFEDNPVVELMYTCEWLYAITITSCCKKTGRAARPSTLHWKRHPIGSAARQGFKP